MGRHDQGRSILISGIGVAGPTLAFWLLEHGFTPTLVERAESLRDGGYVIDFWGLGYDIAERMGLLPELRQVGYDVREIRFVDGDGRRVGGFGGDVFRRLTRGRYLSLPRGELVRTIVRRIDRRCETLFGDTITRIEQRADAVRVEFEHRPARDFALVIGADGLHSQTRRLAFGDQDRFERSLGYEAAVFEVRGYRPRLEDVYVSYTIPGKQVARFALRDDRTLFLFVFTTAEPSPEAHTTRRQKARLREAFGGAGWECPRILAALEACDALYFDRVSQIRMDTWVNGRVALVGDAAFCPSLLAGQGAALAMTAAYVLAGEIARAPSQPSKALACYEQRLRPFISEKQTAARRFAASFAPKSRLGLFLRNQITGAFRLPFVAERLIGRTLLDRLPLPDYGRPPAD